MQAFIDQLTVSERFAQQLTFILETDKLKQVIRRNFIADGSRRENSAEHSWQIVLITLVFADYAKDKDIDLLKVIKMLTIHDLVEIYAGDVFFFDEKACEEKFENEKIACEKLFGLLPDDQREEFTSLWVEFETATSKEAIFANAIDRITPFLLNSVNGGQSWTEAEVKAEQALQKLCVIEKGSNEVWSLFLQLVELAKAKKLLL